MKRLIVSLLLNFRNATTRLTTKWAAKIISNLPNVFIFQGLSYAYLCIYYKYMCVGMKLYTHIYTHIYSHINTYIHTHSHIYKHIHTYIPTYRHIHTYTHTYLHTDTYINTCDEWMWLISMYIYIYICIVNYMNMHGYGLWVNNYIWRYI